MKKLFQFDFKAKHAGLSALLTVGALIGLLVVNLIVQEIPAEADMTRRKLFTLTDETLTLLEGVEKETVIYALYATGQDPEEILKVLRDYERENPYIRLEVVDPDRNPALVAEFQEEGTAITAGSLIVASENRHRVIAGRDLFEVSVGQTGQAQLTGQKIEQQVSSALAYVASGIRPKIYEIIGHQEVPLAAIGYRDILEKANFLFEEISLNREAAIPEDAALVTLIAPQADLSPAETEKIRSYLDRGGRLFVALNLGPETYENLYGLLESWDIVVRHGVVFENRPNRLLPDFGDNPLVFAPLLGDHEIVAPLADAKLDPIVQMSMGFRRTEAEKRNLEYFSLLSSTPESWLRTDIASPEAGRPSPMAGDEGGPVDVAAVIQERNVDTYEPEGARIVVYGSAASLRGLGMLGQIKANADLAVNMVSWAAGGEGTVNIPSKSRFTLPLRLDTARAYLYAGIAVLLIPLLILGAGLTIFFRRRHR